MKKVINGRQYNTDTAKFIDGVYSGIGSFEEYEADLYKKKTGEYFLYESGGPMSRMAVNANYNEVTGSENITPLTVSEVKKWLEDNNLAEAYEKLFSVTEGRTLKELRETKGLTQSELAEKAGVPVGHIQKYETGERDLNKAQGIILLKIAQALDCAIEELINIKE